MSTELATRNGSTVDLSVIERVVALGDLSKLSTEDRVCYYSTLCQSLGFNPLTRPFDYLMLSGKLVLYARKDATDQLRNLRHVSVQIVGKERVDDLYVVTARATLPDGRSDEEIGAVAIGNLKGDVLANALMRAITKAKRRVTLSICGLGLLDESEVSTIPGAQVIEAELPALPAAAPPVEPARSEAVEVLEADLPARNPASLPDEPVPAGEKAGVTALFNQARRELRLSRAGVLRHLGTDSIEACMQERNIPQTAKGLIQVFDLLAFKVDQAQARGGLPEAEPEAEGAEQYAF